MLNITQIRVKPVLPNSERGGDVATSSWKRFQAGDPREAGSGSLYHANISILKKWTNPCRSHWPSVPNTSESTSSPPWHAALLPGECVWVRKHTLNAASWIAGVITKNLGSRVYDVKLENGNVMQNVSGDHIRRRFVQEPKLPDDVITTQPRKKTQQASPIEAAMKISSESACSWTSTTAPLRQYFDSSTVIRRNLARKPCSGTAASPPDGN